MPPKRRVALQSVPLDFGVPRFQSTPLPSQKTWETMMGNLERKYASRGKQKKSKNGKPRRKSAPRARKTTALEKTLLALMTAFPGNASVVKVWPKRSSLCSAVCRAPGTKRKLATFL